MKSSITWKEYQALELLPNSAQPAKPSLWARLRDLGERGLAHIAASSEPHVWTTQDESGQVHWKAYDPITNQSIDSLFEAELRVWLEKRHHINGWYAKA